MEDCVLNVTTAWNLVEVLSPNHNFRATRLGNAVDPKVIGNVIDSNTRTRLGKSAGNGVERADWHAAIIPVNIRVSLHCAVALAVVHLRDHMPLVVGPRIKCRGAWLVRGAVPHVIVDVVTAFRPSA